MAARPLVLPEPFDGEANWEQWDYHFQNVTSVNEWDDGQKLKWLKVRLTGRAQIAFQRLPRATRNYYDAATKALRQVRARQLEASLSSGAPYAQKEEGGKLGRFCRGSEAARRQIFPGIPRQSQRAISSQCIPGSTGSSPGGIRSEAEVPGDPRCGGDGDAGARGLPDAQSYRLLGGT